MGDVAVPQEVVSNIDPWEVYFLDPTNSLCLSCLFSVAYRLFLLVVGVNPPSCQDRQL